jgi:uroporphyrinogen III methyltransferase/synthase
MQERPLTGRRVLVTRARTQAAELVELLEASGAEVVHFAAIEIAPPPSWDSLDAVIDAPASFDWILFTSANGVEAFFARASALRREVSLRAQKVAAVGSATAEALRRHEVESDVVPEKFLASELLPLLPAEQDGVRTAIVRALEGREVLVDELRARGGEVHLALAYETRRAPSLPDEIRSMFACGSLDALTFTSPSTVEGTMKHLTPDEVERLARTCLFASIGPVTTKAIARYGATNVVEAEESTVAGLCAAVTVRLSQR